MSPKGVPSQLLVEHEVNLVPCTPGLELPGRHSQKGFAHDLVDALLEEIRSRYIGWPLWSFPSLARLPREICVLYFRLLVSLSNILEAVLECLFFLPLERLQSPYVEI